MITKATKLAVEYVPQFGPALAVNGWRSSAVQSQKMILPFKVTSFPIVPGTEPYGRPYPSDKTERWSLVGVGVFGGGCTKGAGHGLYIDPHGNFLPEPEAEYAAPA
jgi:hypothetical protein